MKSLTPSEARVLAFLLGCDISESERSRLGRSGVPRSTYQDVRARAYREGWLRDRYIPSPAALGRPVGLFLTARPFVDGSAELERRWSLEPGVVVLWTSSEIFFAVAFCQSEEGGQRTLDRLIDSRIVQSSNVVWSDLTRTDSVPVYFDFEGAWTHLVAFPGTGRYPRPLTTPGGASPSGVPPALIGPARQLVARPIIADPGRPLHRLGPFGLPRSQRRLIERGLVTHRTLLDPLRVPDVVGARPELAIVVQGNLMEEATAQRILEHLVAVGVFPVLLVQGRGRFLALLLGQRRRPTPATGGQPVRFQATVLTALSGLVHGVEVAREDWENLRVVIDHRYDRLTTS